MKQIKLNSNNLGRSIKNILVLSGRDFGYDIRKRLNLDKIDKDGEEYEVIFPESIISISTSFFLALFGDSVRYFNEKDKFLDKYRFICSEHLKKNISDGIKDALNNVDGLS